MRSTTLAAPLLLRSAARAARARGVAAAAGRRCPARRRRSGRAARDVHLDGFAPLELVEAEETDASITIHAPENTRALSGVDPALMSARPRARVPRCARRRWRGGGACRCGRRRRWRRTRACRWTDFAAFVPRALFLDRDDPVGCVAGAVARRRLGWSSGCRLASELRIEGEGTDLVVGVAGRVVDQLGWAAEHAFGRGVHRAVETRPRARPLRRSRLRRAACGSSGIISGVPRRRRGGGARRRGRRGPAGDARHRRRRPPARRGRHRHQLRHRPRGRADPARREDRRHRPPRPRPLVPGDRRHQRVRHPLGHDLHLRRRPPHRRRRADPRDGQLS